MKISLIHPGHILLIHFSCIYKDNKSEAFSVMSMFPTVCSSVKTEVQKICAEKVESSLIPNDIFSQWEKKCVSEGAACTGKSFKIPTFMPASL